MFVLCVDVCMHPHVCFHIYIYMVCVVGWGGGGGGGIIVLMSSQP